MTLLANRGALPLAPSVRRVALIGTDAVEGRLGGYSGPGNDVVSIRAALEARLGRERVRYEPGPGRTTGQFRTIPASAFEGGVQVEYFRGIELTGSPAVTNRVATIEANWPFGPPDSSLAAGWYAVRWSARLRAPSREPTQLVIDGNDGFRLWLDGKLIIDRWQNVSGGIVGAPVRLGDGNAHDVILEYFENVGPARIRLGWTLGGAWEDNARIARAVAIARGSQTAIIVAGIDEGEFQDRASLRLPGRQEELIRAVAATGVPIVVVLIGGSAVTMSDWVDSAGAVLLAWYPGEVGGTAVAATLVGDHNPAGRLPITFPQSEGQLPLSYFHRPTGRGDDYRDLSGRPQFPFGFGLSYTQFDYRDLGITPASPGAGDSVVVRFTLRNVGSIAGEEVPQVYLHDVVSSVASPVLTLAGFARLRLQPGEERQVTVTLAPDRFTMLDQELARRIEAGAVDIWVGASSADLRLRKRILVR